MALRHVRTTVYPLKTMCEQFAIVAEKSRVWVMTRLAVRIRVWRVVSTQRLHFRLGSRAWGSARTCSRARHEPCVRNLDQALSTKLWGGQGDDNKLSECEEHACKRHRGSEGSLLLKVGSCSKVARHGKAINKTQFLEFRCY